MREVHVVVSKLKHKPFVGLGLWLIAWLLRRVLGLEEEEGWARGVSSRLDDRPPCARTPLRALGGEGEPLASACDERYMLGEGCCGGGSWMAARSATCVAERSALRMRIVEDGVSKSGPTADGESGPSSMRVVRSSMPSRMRVRRTSRSCRLLLCSRSAASSWLASVSSRFLLAKNSLVARCALFRFKKKKNENKR